MVLIALASLVPLLPALVMGGGLSGDSPVHVRWQAHFAEQVWRGTPYPRWLPDMNRGFGSPAFFFYPPLVQWLGALFWPVLPGPGQATIRLILAVWLASMAGGTGLWLWLRALGSSSHAAVLGGLVFLLMPYRCFVDFYARGALAELAGMCVMPWLLWSATRLKAGRRGAWSAHALGIGAICYSHLPAALMGMTFASCYVLALARPRDWQFVARAASATLAGLLIGALCLVPALGLLGLLTDTAAMWGPRNQPVQWLLFSRVPWIDPSMQAQTLLLLGLALVAGTGLTVLAARLRDPQLRRVAWFLAGAILLVALLNTAPARAFWALQTPFSRIQFPFRLLSIQAVALSGLAGLALHRLERVGEEDGDGAMAAARHAGLWRRLLWGGVAGLLLLNAGMLTVQRWRSRDHRPPGNAQVVASDIDTSEYVLGRLDAAVPLFGPARSRVLSGTARTHVLVWEGRRLALDVAATTPATLALRQFVFTGWECRIDQGPWRRAATLVYPRSVPLCAVPAGRHLLEARMPASPAEQVGGGLTLLGLALALLGLRGGRRMRRDSRDLQSAPPLA